MCISGALSWEEAQIYCEKKGGEMLLEAVQRCDTRPGGGGEWLGLKKRWMLKMLVKTQVNNI